MADDGKVLGRHICSNISFMLHDLVFRKDRRQIIEKYFGANLEDIQIYILKPGETPPASVIIANEKRRKQAEEGKTNERN